MSVEEVILWILAMILLCGFFIAVTWLVVMIDIARKVTNM